MYFYSVIAKCLLVSKWILPLQFSKKQKHATKVSICNWTVILSFSLKSRPTLFTQHDICTNDKDWPLYHHYLTHVLRPEILLLVNVYNSIHVYLNRLEDLLQWSVFNSITSIILMFTAWIMTVYEIISFNTDLCVPFSRCVSLEFCTFL